MKKNIWKSVRFKLFLTLCIVIGMIIGFFIIINSVILETLYYYSKKNASIFVYDFIDENIPKIISETDKETYELNLEKIEVTNNFELLIINENGEIVYATKNDFMKDFGSLNEINYTVNYSIFNKADIMIANEKLNIRKIKSKKTDLQYVLLEGKLENGNKVYIRMPVTPLEDNAAVSNKFLWIIGFAAVILGGIAIIVIAKKFTEPIEELNSIANEMKNLNFKNKYRINDSGDEIDELGKSINALSDELENTINQLKLSNSKLERDIEEKSKIDEMRKRFISDVSHELKTPIALIQGYAEGLIENVNSDEENRKFYADVIFDEANKMDKLVKRLLELMKLEYDEREFNDKKFDIVELVNGVIKNSQKVISEENIKLEFKEKDPIYVFADDFYIEQVITNYFTNAIKNIVEINGKKQIKIGIKNSKETDKVRISVFNTGNQISEENLNRIWTRFYKIDESRDRSKGGTGIGLSIVKAIMTKYKCAYGVKNKKDGVEFYFEIYKAK